MSPKQVWKDLNEDFNGFLSHAIVKDDEIDKKLKTALSDDFESKDINFRRDFKRRS